MAISSESHKQFVEFIKLQVFDDGYIDRQEEKVILEKGINLGISVDSGLAIINQVATSNGYVVERLVNERSRQILNQFASNDGKIDKKEFDDAVAWIKQLILDNGWKVKEGGLFGSKWFSAIN